LILSVFYIAVLISFSVDSPIKDQIMNFVAFFSFAFSF